MNGQLVFPQTYVGRVNVVGECYCLGLVADRRPPTYKNIPVYISVAGPATSVEALWAKLSQGKEATVIPDDHTQQAIYLEPNAAGLYTRFQKKIEALGIDHLILVHEDMAEPTYPTATGEKEAATTYIMKVSDDQLIAKLGEHVRKTVKVAVFDQWLPFLLGEGRAKGLVRDCAGYGNQAISVKLDTLKWTSFITSGLSSGGIALP